MGSFVVIEQGEDGEAYVSKVSGYKDIRDVFENHQSMDGACFVVLSNEAFKKLKEIK